MRVGIVGAGFMGMTHAASWAETDVKIAGFTSKPLGEAQAAAEQYQTRAYADYDALLQDVDVVDICVPTHLHHAMVLKAAEAGKDIICEKPLAYSIEEGQEMIAACREAGVKLLVAHVVRFFPEYSQAQQMIENGQIGKPAVIRLSRESFQPHKSKDNWYVDFDKSGGMLLDLMIHDFDYARWIGGEVVRVFARSLSNTRSDAAVEHAFAILTHRGGAISHIEGSWAYPQPMFVTRIDIAGSDGLVKFDSGETAPINIHLHKQDSEKQAVAAPSSPLSESPYTTQIKAFYHALVDDQPVPVSAEDGLAALQIAWAAIESARTGRAITLESLPEVVS